MELFQFLTCFLLFLLSKSLLLKPVQTEKKTYMQNMFYKFQYIFLI